MSRRTVVDLPKQRCKAEFDSVGTTYVIEPTGQYAAVVDADQVPFVRIGHRWYRAGNPTVTPTPWPEVRAVRVLSGGQS